MPASIGAPPGALLWSSGSATVDEALNQREFEAARQAWLQSGQTTKPVAAAKPVAATKGKSVVGKKVLDRADLLMAETQRMEARLALLRQTMNAEKAKRPPSKSTLSSSSKLGSAGGVGSYRHVSSRVETQNTFLNVKTASERDAKLTAAREARAQAEEARVKAEEARKMAEFRAQGHTLVTYAEAEAVPQWILHREEDEVAAQAEAIRGIGISVRGAAPTTTRTVARKQITAADMLRSRRHGSAQGAKPIAGAAAIAAAASTAKLAQPHSSPATHTTSSARPSISSSSSSSTLTSHVPFVPFVGSSLLDGDLDEESNAAEFAAAREEFLRSIQTDKRGDDAADQSLRSDPIPTSSPAETSRVSGVSTQSDPPPATSDTHAAVAPSFLAGDFTSAALPSNWWEQDDPDSNATAAPGSLLSGPDFDERDSAGAFQAAREQWLSENAANQVRASSAARPSLDDASSLGDSILPAASAVAAVAAVAAAPAAAAKSSCYTCYKLFFQQSGVFDAESEKHFCTSACMDVFRAERKESCRLCRKKVQRQHATRDEQGWTCRPCHEESIAASDAVASEHVDSLPSDEPLISLFGSDDLLASLATMQPMQPLQPRSDEYTPRSKHHTPKARKAHAMALDDSGTISAWED